MNTAPMTMADVVAVLRAGGYEPRQSGAGYKALCPGHDDDAPSLSISEGAEGRVLLRCFAGCAFDAICAGLGIQPADLAGDALPRSGGNGHGRNGHARPKRQRGDDRVFATAEEAADAALMSIRRRHPEAAIARLFRWSETYVRVRVEWPDPEGGKPAKEYRPIVRDGDGWHLRGPAGKAPLYRVDDLPTDLSAVVCVVEGEPPADAGREIGLPVTTSGSSSSAKAADWSPLSGRRVVILPDNDAPGAKYAQAVAAELLRLDPPAADVRIVALPGLPPGGDLVEWIGARDTRTAEELRAELAEIAAATKPEAAPAARPNVLVTTEEHEVISQTIAALAADPDLYQRGGRLVRVERSCELDDGVKRPLGATTIGFVPLANLRERCATWATFTAFNAKGIEHRTHPPRWAYEAIAVRGEWPGIRVLGGLSDAPIVRKDGSVWQTPGYDAETGVLFEPSATFPPVPMNPDVDAAHAAVTMLAAVVTDFSFQGAEHRSAWLAGLLTPLARWAFDGPAPLFLVDANIRGAGKGLLCQVAGRIATGRDLPVSSYDPREGEMRKVVTSIAIAGDRLVQLDNVEGMLGSADLDRALTATRWRDRLLSRNEEINLPLQVTWWASGNNVRVGADTVRRTLHIRLDVLTEKPEERTGFVHPNLVMWVTENRGELLTAALTILAAYLQAGRPDQQLVPMGSFEGWSSVVRSALVWAGEPDPYLTRAGLEDVADSTGEILVSLVDAWTQYDAFGEGVVVADMLRQLYPEGDQPKDEVRLAMRAALEAMTNCRPGQVPTARQVGNKLRAFRGRVVNGARLELGPKSKAGAVWRLIRK